MQGIVDTVQRLITKGLTLILRDSVKVAIDFFIIVGIIYTPFGAEIVTKVVTTLRRVVWFRPPGFLIAAASALNANPSRREESAVTIGFCIDSEKVSRHSIMPMVFRHGRFKHGLVTNPSKLLCVIWQMRSWVARELGCRSTAALLKLIEGDGGDKVQQKIQGLESKQRRDWRQSPCERHGNGLGRLRKVRLRHYATAVESVA